MAQEVEHLSQALRSILSTSKEKVNFLCLKFILPLVKPTLQPIHATPPFKTLCYLSQSQQRHLQKGEL
jgi:hypothetical protein